jgi:hypothetical protein
MTKKKTESFQDYPAPIHRSGLRGDFTISANVHGQDLCDQFGRCLR